MPSVTVCILTYNPDWTKFRNTLKSIICQKGVDFDIVISDDGSKDNCFDKAEAYLKDNYFFHYQLVENTVNQGTVKNTLSALQHTESKYVKLISTGDYLSDEYVLSEFVNYAENNPASAYFGNAVYYSANNKKDIKIYADKRNPRDLSPWIADNDRAIRRNYLYDTDYIVGASLFCRRNIFGEYLKKIEGVVIYAEDFSIVWMIAAHQKVKFINRLFIFYEYGLGISTSTNQVWTERLYNDNMKGFELMYKHRNISKLELMYYKSKNRIKRTIYRLMLEPLYIVRRFQKKQEKSEIGDIEECKIKLLRLLNNDEVS